MNKLLFFALLFLSFVSCQKEEGLGGTASITGRIWVLDYDSNGNLKGQGEGRDERVYIIYGDDAVHSDETRASYNGMYRFDNLQKGNYKIFAYSNCDLCASGNEAVILDATVSHRGEEVVLEDLVLEH
jgi:hypothetical protein